MIENPAFFLAVFERWAGTDKARARLWKKHLKRFNKAKDLQQQRQAIRWMFDRLTPADLAAIDEVVASLLATELTDGEASALIENLARIRPELAGELPGLSGEELSRLAVSELRRAGGAIH